MQLVKPNKVKITPPWFCKGLAESLKKRGNFMQNIEEEKTQLWPMRFFIMIIILYSKEFTERQNQIIIQRNFRNTPTMLKRPGKL